MSLISDDFSSALMPRLGATQLTSSCHVDPTKCESSLQLGVFFDGTRNNKRVDEERLAHTNVSRLYQAYPRSAGAGTYSVYIPGVGTPFPDIGEDGASAKGAGYGAGGEGRILYALLMLLTTIHQHAFSGMPLFSREQIRILCSKKEITRDAEIRAVKRNAGLLEQTTGDGRERNAYLRAQAGALKVKLQQQKLPVVKECVLDVFGFSRGAAEARVFCNWLLPLLHEGRLCGIPLVIRFLGIFDTVAAVGLASGVAGVLTKVKMGHDDWASVGALRIPKAVKQCVHMVAMHEIRKNFPLDCAAVNGVMPTNAIELAYPGSHSDLGGGYEPGELGVSTGADKQLADSTKLSQIPLNHMLAFASRAGVPLDKGLAVTKASQYDPFALHPSLQSAYADFLRELGPRPRKMYEWMQPYLSWRWQVRKTFTSLRQYREANEHDRALLAAGNRRLVNDGELLLSRGNMKEALAHRSQVRQRGSDAYDLHHTQPALELAHVDEEAPVVMKEALAHPVSQAMGDFFDRYVHDSLAGFGIGMEPTGYWRYRKAFQGSARTLFADNGNADNDSEVRDRA